LSPTVEGVGILEQGNTIVDTFALTNGTVGSPRSNWSPRASIASYTTSPTRTARSVVRCT
jgi:hypothetical protein